MSYISLSPSSIRALDDFDNNFVEAILGTFDFEMNGKHKLHRNGDVGNFVPDEKHLPEIFNQIDKLINNYLAEFDPTKDFCSTDSEERKILDGVLKIGRVKVVEVPVFVSVQKTTHLGKTPCYYGYFLGKGISRFIMVDGRWFVRTKANTFILDNVMVNGVYGRIVSYRRCAQPLMIPPFNDASFNIVPTEAVLMREIMSSLVRDEPFLHEASADQRSAFWFNTKQNNAYKLSVEQQDEFSRIRRIIRAILEQYNSLTKDSVAHCHPTLLEEINALLDQTRR